MNCKKVYLGQEIENEEWSYGLGSVYLAGPRNPKGKSWRLDVISKLEESGTPMAIFIPETKSQLRGGFNKSPSHVIYDWQRFAMSMASAIIFWYPKDAYDAQSLVEFGLWHKSERIFLGREDPKKNEYLDWVLYKEQMLYPADTIDQVIEMYLHWVRE